MPFAYVQFNALMLLGFMLLCPIAVAAFTETLTLTIIITLCVSGGFCAMWIIANEMEDPFGVDDNDLPMLEFHEVFCAQLRSLLVMVLADDFGYDEEEMDKLQPEELRKSVSMGRRHSTDDAPPKEAAPPERPPSAREAPRTSNLAGDLVSSILRSLKT